MENALVEEMAASLVREFLSKKGLKKTSSTMDKEFPRTALSINNRNELRNILHLQSLYKMNKAKENPLKTLLEIITSYFLEHPSNSQGIKGGPSAPQNQLSQPRATDSFIFKKSLRDEATWQLPGKNKTETYRYETDEETIHPTGLLGRHLPKKSEQSKPDEVLNSSSLTLGEKKPVHHCEGFQTTELPLETRRTMREKLQTKPGGLVARGMLSNLTDTSQEDSSKRRHLKRLSGITSMARHGEEDGTKGSLPVDDSQENQGIPSHPPSLLSSCSPTSLDVSKDPSSRDPHGPHANPGDKVVQNLAISKGEPFANLISERCQLEERKLVSSYDTKMNKKSSCLNLFQKQMPTESEKRERLTKNSEIQVSDGRKTPASTSTKEHMFRDTLELVDVSDEETVEEAYNIPDSSTLHVLQVSSKPIDFFLARDLKILLFGSNLGCFSEEWKIQSFTFDCNPPLKYGIVQKKGGPCGVLAAVQACVLRHLIFGDSNRNSDTRCLQPSDMHRTKCLILALAGILWRAGGNKKAVVTLSSGMQQFTPAGKYKADGILEMLVLYSMTTYEDLLTFLQEHIHQFEAGPYGCILLTLSVILSRSVDQVREDFDVFTNRLIGVHGYCSQELVNLLLTGKAVSNVFNDEMDLDSGNGNIMVLKGIGERSDVGLLSLFEHYDVCQVGCYLKTPKFPIWLVCSESHFSVLFCLRKDLLGDWKTERRFDLYYYDGLANQQEEIRLTIALQSGALKIILPRLPGWDMAPY
ncbi:probable ubiquitin carboxyl-terminal hydrolase MINDY-4 isoform X2 [Sceloporus undulatus]|uniref:probable ubiquitin carboxyl-terminal hydrolase MINDY-4 isoform X2 n=1 Tax=Sceloporus undulatus TaxID=8520 RepID=UPI001C4B6963|nr:probable ubiquitin carboxyl-terminal hydrolase MINDY-4 isoform X2 [Sceloporus undulatus]